MELRKHPLMHHGEKSNWPPSWTRASIDAPGRRLMGETGTLKRVEYDTTTTGKCFLLMEHENQDYVGTLLFDDGMFCWLLSVALKQHIGKSIKEIGDLDLPYTPNEDLKKTA